MPASAMYATLLGAPLAGPESGSDCMTGKLDRTRKWRILSRWATNRSELECADQGERSKAFTSNPACCIATART
jgi:hypothetical protein